jgi:hypothetical protein
MICSIKPLEIEPSSLSFKSNKTDFPLIQPTKTDEYVSKKKNRTRKLVLMTTLAAVALVLAKKTDLNKVKAGVEPLFNNSKKSISSLFNSTKSRLNQIKKSIYPVIDNVKSKLNTGTNTVNQSTRTIKPPYYC